jgi:hypothetical protein
MKAEPDFRQFYDLESYLFDAVHSHFEKYGELSAFDFFCIIIWKANRAKSRIAKRLLERGYKDLDTAVRELTRGLAPQSPAKERLQYLVRKWGFYLPIASAILAVLYPDEFTIYDTRVCDTLKEICGKEFHYLGNLTNPDRLWKGYEDFRQQVKESAPGYPTLRDKDRYLWGKSFYDQLKGDIERKFEKVEKHNPGKPDLFNEYLQLPEKELEWEL